MAKAKKSVEVTDDQFDLLCCEASRGEVKTHDGAVKMQATGDVLRQVASGMLSNGWSFFEILQLARAIKDLVEKVGPDVEAILKKIKEIFGK